MVEKTTHMFVHKSCAQKNIYILLWKKKKKQNGVRFGHEYIEG